MGTGRADSWLVDPDDRTEILFAKSRVKGCHTHPNGSEQPTQNFALEESFTQMVVWFSALRPRHRVLYSTTRKNWRLFSNTPAPITPIEKIVLDSIKVTNDLYSLYL
jgi:hypothetical protein